MNPLLLIHGYSAESDEETPAAITSIYGTLPKDLVDRYGAGNVFELDVSRYISLEDGIRLDDVSRAMDQALRADFPHLLDGHFDVLIHSTGALVARNWVRRYSRKPSPVDRLIYLAGANFGSGWAHVGKGQLAKWGRFVFQGGAERGVRILDSLELGSAETLDLHLHFLATGNRMLEDYRVREFCITGSQARASWLRFPIRYSHEDGSDGVVRVSASNLNFNHVRLVPKQRALDPGWEALASELDELSKPPEEREFEPDEYYRVADQYLADEDPDPGVPLGILFECAHSGDDMGIVTGGGPRRTLLELLDEAREVETKRQYANAVKAFDRHTGETYRRAAEELEPGFLSGLFHEPREQYDAHAQVIFRLRDHYGRPVEHFDLFFHSGSADEVEWSADRPDGHSIKTLFEHTHKNSVTDGIIVFYLRVSCFDDDEGGWVDCLGEIDGVALEIVPTEPHTGEIAYLPLRLVISGDRLRRFIRAHQTTVIDVEMPRLPSSRVFRAVGAEV